jgi:hypothetical protein
MTFQVRPQGFTQPGGRRDVAGRIWSCVLRATPLWQLLLLCSGALLGGAGWGAEANQQPVTRYECLMTGGRIVVVPEDISVHFGWSARCRPFEVLPSQPESIAAIPVTPGPRFSKSWASLWPRQRPALRTQGRLMDSPYSEVIRQAAARHRLEPRLLMAIAQVESGHQPLARSRAGALGLMQIMPATGARYGVYQSQHLFDPGVNIDVAARYINDLLDQFHGSLELTVAAYNAGEGAVEKYGRHVPPYPETRRYVREVMTLLASN